MSVLKKLFVSNGAKFYVLFERASVNLIDMSTLFEQVVSGKTVIDRENVLKKMKKLNDSSDKLAHKLLIELGGNYITPFDREDIHYLASSLDEIAHDLWGISRLYHRYSIEDENNASLEVAADFQSFFKLLEVAIKGLKNQFSLKLLSNKCDEMRALNSKSDSRIDDTIARLVNAGASQPKSLLQKMDYYELLQTTNGNCRKAINVIEGIIIKYG